MQRCLAFGAFGPRLHLPVFSFRTSTHCCRIGRDFSFERVGIGRSRGFGFVTFSNRDCAELAISKTDGQEWMGRTICVKVSKPGRDGEAAVRISGGGRGAGGGGGAGVNLLGFAH